MDISQINWAYFALTVSALLLIGWIARARATGPGAMGLIVGFAHLLTAALNSAAPVRGYVDPDYVGYGFGLLAADSGLAVTIMSGAVWIVGVLGAFLALGRRRAAMAVVALSSLAFTIVLGAPLVQGAIANPAANSIQFSEYLTLPGLASTALMLILLVLPFALGVLWAGRRAVTGR